MYHKLKFFLSQARLSSIFLLISNIFKMQCYPAAERNKEPILEVLKRFYRQDESFSALEISSGSGQHVTHFAKYFSNAVWQPSEYDQSLLTSITAYITSNNLKSVLPPIIIDVEKDPDVWNKERKTFNLVFNANLIHISPFSCTEGLFITAGCCLKNDGTLLTYGPYAVDGVLSPESNVQFDRSLRSRNPSWGVRDTSILSKLAEKNGLKLKEMIDMPANNKVLVFKKIA